MMRIQQSIAIGGQTIQTRVVVPPMADFGATGADGLVNDRHLRHYRSFATGGAGLIIIEACAVSNMKEARNTIGVYSDHCLTGLGELAVVTKSGGAGALVQLLHSGLRVMTECTIADIPKDQFIRYKKDFVSAAVRCQKAGFDGAELHAAHGFYLNQIVETSTRDDEYGGSFENRVRILCELIQEIKAACGAQFIVSVRFGSGDPQALLRIAEAIEAAGGDLLHVSWGLRSVQAPADFPYSDTVYMAALVKEHARIPVICVGNITTGAQAEDILHRGYADMTAVGRGHLCDPAWARKAFEGRASNPCLNCRRCLWFVDGKKCPVRQKEGFNDC